VPPTATPVPPTATAVPPTAAPQPLTLSGTFNNAGPEPVSGRAILGRTAEGKVILRFENFQSHPGPDLFVYLVKSNSPNSAGQVEGGLQVARLRATSGNQNYELNPSLDITQYKSVVVYCKAFSVVFGFANLS
jgi:Electron transfer DM13